MSLDLKWVGCKVHGMSINEALEFYGPVRHALRKKLVEKIGVQALEATEKEFAFKFSPEDAQSFTELTGKAFADDQFEQIVEFMAGKRPGEVAVEDLDKPAGAKCMVLIFDGKDAVARIRHILGPTNPAQASGGTIRYDFGKDIMVNAAHASDSQDSYLRESSIIKVNNNALSRIAAEYK
jgi:nucleoside diphosphate kinase